jgi:hypothetical protein
MHEDGKAHWINGGAGYVLSRDVLKKTYGLDPWGFEHKWDQVMMDERGGDVALRVALNATEGITLEKHDAGEMG